MAQHNIADGLVDLAVPVDDLVVDPDNAVKHDSTSVNAIARSLEAFGQDQPLVVQRSTNVVRKGNGRLAAAKQLGWTHVAAIVIDEDNVDAVARALADNRTSEFRKWDDERLADLLTIVKQQGRDIQDTGYSEEDLQGMLGKVSSHVEEDVEADEYPTTDTDGFMSANQVRMVNLFLNVEKFVEYTQMIQTLQNRWGLDNASDTVMEALRREDGRGG